MKTIHLLFFFFFVSLPSLFCLEGICYSYLEKTLFSPCPISQAIHLIEVDPSCYKIKPVKALDYGLGRESVLSIAKRYRAIAAINGGFFDIGGTLDGRACGCLKIHNWYALPFKPRACIGWSLNHSLPLMDRLLVFIRCDFDGKTFYLDGLNRERKEKEAILFTSEFHKTTLTYPNGEELIVEEDVITSIQKNQGSSKIPFNGFVLSIDKKHPFYGKLKEGLPIQFQVEIHSQTGLTDHKDWETCDFIVGGTPLLIYQNDLITNFDVEKTRKTFLTNRHARTAVGILENGHFLFVVVDKTNFFDGMTMLQLRNLMKDLGCTYAMNLDGGGSSTMVYENMIVNSPFGDEDEDFGKKKVRRVSDAIIMIPKNLN